MKMSLVILLFILSSCTTDVPAVVDPSRAPICNEIIRFAQVTLAYKDEGKTIGWIKQAIVDRWGGFATPEVVAKLQKLATDIYEAKEPKAVVFKYYNLCMGGKDIEI